MLKFRQFYLENIEHNTISKDVFYKNFEEAFNDLSKQQMEHIALTIARTMVERYVRNIELEDPDDRPLPGLVAELNSVIDDASKGADHITQNMLDFTELDFRIIHQALLVVMCHNWACAIDNLGILFRNLRKDEYRKNLMYEMYVNAEKIGKLHYSNHPLNNNVKMMARQAYHSVDRPEDLIDKTTIMVLADALEESDYQDQKLLSHLRHDSTNIRKNDWLWKALLTDQERSSNVA
jgi:hypothetical protein